VQFIELYNSSKSEQSLAGKEITITDIDTGQVHTLTLPESLPGTAANHDLLIGTAGLEAADGKTPDYIMPDDFMFTDPIYITMGGVNNGPYCPYSALPVPTVSIPAKTSSAVDTTGDVNNQLSSTGQAASIDSGAIAAHGVPEPSSLVLLVCGGLGLSSYLLFLLLRRRAV
jgi:hypothetical protein